MQKFLNQKKTYNYNFKAFVFITLNFVFRKNNINKLN